MRWGIGLGRFGEEDPPGQLGSAAKDAEIVELQKKLEKLSS